VDDDGRIRASDADRDKVVDILRAAYGEGRLSLEEFDERTTAAYAAKTWSALRELTADLPAGVGMAGPGLPAAGIPPGPPGFGPGEPRPADRRFFPVPLVPIALLAFLALGGHAVILVPIIVIVFVWLRMIGRHHHHPPDRRPGSGPF
jgi:hypothetical protein